MQPPRPGGIFLTGPLHGYRVIDLSSMISGPLGTMRLADQGADVIKVKVPGGGHTRVPPSPAAVASRRRS